MIIDTNSFEGYTNPTDQWDAFLQGPNSAGGIAAIGRNGGSGFHITSNAPGGYCGLQRNITNTTSLIAGFAVQINTYPTVAGGNLSLFSFVNGGGSLIELRIDSSGILQFTANGTNIGAAATAAMTFSPYHYIQIKTTINSSAGVVECVLDTTTVISESSLNTGTGGCTAIVFGAGNGTGSTFQAGDINMDDFVLIDTSDSSSYLGDATVQAILPSSVGSFSDFVRGGTDSGFNFSQVNQVPALDDGSYVASSTVGNRDSYKFTPLALTGQVFGLHLKARAKKTDTGDRSIAVKARSASTDSPDTPLALTTNYQCLHQLLPTDPATGQPWTINALNAAEFGPKVVG